MKTLRSFLRPLIPALAGTAMLASQAGGVPMVSLDTGNPDVANRVQTVAGDCYAIGQQVAAQNGGTLARASPDTQGGQAVCVIVVLVPGRDGQRPRRAEFVVPQN